MRFAIVLLLAACAACASAPHPTHPDHLVSEYTGEDDPVLKRAPAGGRYDLYRWLNGMPRLVGVFEVDQDGNLGFARAVNGDLLAVMGESQRTIGDGRFCWHTHDPADGMLLGLGKTLEDITLVPLLVIGLVLVL